MPKKICHVAGAEMTVRFLLMPQLQFLRGLGYEVHAVCPPGNQAGATEAEGIPIRPIAISRKVSPLADLVSLWNLFWYFKKETFDLVHTHAPKPGLLGQLAARLAGVPVVINTVHGLYVTEHTLPEKRMFFIALEKLAARCSTVILSQSKEDIGTLVQEKIAPGRKVRYLGNGIDLRRFDPRNISAEVLEKKKQELGIPAGAKVVGTVGRLVKEKGYVELFEAMRQVRQKYPEAVLVAVGPEEPGKADGFKPGLEREYGLEGRVFFLGERRDMEAIYPIMDVFAFASRREGFPRSVIEAMAMERPVVATDIRGCREEITNGVHGLLVPPKNSAALADAIIRLLGNQEEARRYAAAAGERARAEFDETMVFGRIKETYEQCLQQKK